MGMAYYSKRHYDRLSNGRPDTADTIAWRKANAEALRLAHEETAERFPTITPANFAAADAFREERIAYHTARLLSVAKKAR